MARFLHHYTRWEAHGDSARLERKMAEVASSRLAPVVEAATEFDGSPNFNFGGKGTILCSDPSSFADNSNLITIVSTEQGYLSYIPHSWNCRSAVRC